MDRHPAKGRRDRRPPYVPREIGGDDRAVDHRPCDAEGGRRDGVVWLAERGKHRLDGRVFRARERGLCTPIVPRAVPPRGTGGAGRRPRRPSPRLGGGVEEWRAVLTRPGNGGGGGGGHTPPAGPDAGDFVEPQAVVGGRRGAAEE